MRPGRNAPDNEEKKMSDKIRTIRFNEAGAKCPG